MPKIGSLEIPDTKLAVNVETNPAGVNIHRAVVDGRGKVLSHKTLALTWQGLAELIDERGQERVPQTSGIVNPS